MARNYQEYQMLQEVRGALIGAKATTEGIKNAEKALQEIPSASDLTPPEKWQFHLPELQDLIARRRRRMENSYAEESDRKTNLAIFGAMLGLIVVAVALIFLSIYFPWQKYNDIYAERTILGENVSPHITFLAAYVVIDILALLIIPIICDASDGIILKISKWVVMISLSVIGLVAFCVSIGDMWNSQEGKFQFISFLIANVVCIFRWLLGIIFWIPFLIVICGTIYFIYMIEENVFICPERYSFDRDYDFKYSPEYRRLVKQEAAMQSEMREEYRTLYNQLLRKYADQRKYYSNLIEAFQKIKSNCVQKINTADLHPSYKTISMIEKILFYFDMNRAETLREALNEIAHDEQILALVEELRRLKQQVAKTQEIYVKTLKEQQQQYFAKLNELRDTYSSQIDSLIKGRAQYEKDMKKEYELLRKKLSRYIEQQNDNAFRQRLDREQELNYLHGIQTKIDNIKYDI